MTGRGFDGGGSTMTAALEFLSCRITAAEENWGLKRLTLLLSGQGTSGIQASLRFLFMTLMREVLDAVDTGGVRIVSCGGVGFQTGSCGVR